MNPQDPLAQLRDIHVPEPISWWPPAPGWWLLAVLVIATMAGLLIWLKNRRLHRRYRQQALQQLKQLEQNFQQHQDSQHYLQELVNLLRRSVKTAFPQQQWETLPITELTAALQQQTQGKCFTADYQQLEPLLYGPPAEQTDDSAIQQFASSLSHWLHKHRETR